MMKRMPENDYSNNLLATFHMGHTISMNTHIEEVQDVLRPRSAFVLPNRCPAYPALAPDNTEDLIMETTNRRNAHRRLMSANNGMGSFRKSAKPESTSDYFHQKHLVRDYLNSIHLDKKTVKSRRPQTTPTPARDSIHKDFLTPQDPVAKRQTGYNKGHIRSILKLETYGPLHSDALREERSRGSLPGSPNNDRNRLISNERIALKSSGGFGNQSTNSPGSPPSRPGSPLATISTSSMGEGMNEFFGTSNKNPFPSTSPPLTKRGVKYTKKLRNIEGKIANDLANSATLKDEYREHLLQLNPISRGRQWFKTYTYTQRMDKKDKEALEDHRKYRAKVKEEADDSAAKLRDFERKLSTMKRR